MQTKFLFILLIIVLLSLPLLVSSVKITGQGLGEIQPTPPTAEPTPPTAEPTPPTAEPTPSAPSTAEPTIVEGNPFADTQFKKPLEVSPECKACSSILQCLACIDKEKFVQGIAAQK